MHRHTILSKKLTLSLHCVSFRQAGWTFSASNFQFSLPGPGGCDTTKLSFLAANVADGTMSGSLMGSGCGTVTVRTCYAQGAGTGLTGAVRVSVCNPSNVCTEYFQSPYSDTDYVPPTDVYFTFNDGDTLKIEELGLTNVQVSSLTFQPCNSDLATAVNVNGGAIATTVSPPAALPAAMTSVSSHPCTTHAHSRSEASTIHIFIGVLPWR